MPVYFKNKKGGGAYIIVSKETSHFKYVFKEKRKHTTNKDGRDKRSKSFKLYNHNKICCQFLSFYVLLGKLAKHT